MSFKDLLLKVAYDSDEDDILNDFYIPVLTSAKEYYRLAGFFSSSVLALAAEGLAPFISNKGKMKLVVGAILSKQDVDSIIDGIKYPEKIISDNIILDIESIKDKFLLDHLKALSWMVANENLEIKIAIPLDSNNNPIATDEAILRGIFHQKVGVFIDENNNKISFSGSINESAYGWLNNVEEFKVFRSWILNEYKYIKSDLDKFNKYYDGMAKNTLVFSIPEALKLKILEYQPREWNESILTNYLPKQISKKIQKKKSLWPHQKEAIELWTKNGYKGILAMATGSGKTFTALSTLNLPSNICIIIITVPTKPLLKQWMNEIVSFDESADIITCSSDKEWRKLLSLKLSGFRKDKTKKNKGRLFVVSTMNTASSKSFLMAFKGISEEVVQIVCDEVHHAGASSFQNITKINSLRRLGLSATPERQWDYEGTQTIIDYFGETVYEYSLGDAIRDGYLSKYRYYPYFAQLNADEFDDYKNYTKEINKEIAIIKAKKNKDDDYVLSNKTKKLENLLIERASIKKKAEDKIRVFGNILMSVNIRPLIVFCEDNEQLEEIKIVLKGENVLMYNSDMNSWQQEKTLNMFRKGEVDILLAIRCLDEGLDVPDCKGCIIMASSSSTREFIQRRGRILRGQKDKEAILNDIIVLPPEIHSTSDSESAKNLISQEMSRMKELVNCSENEWETRNIIRRELEKYGLEHLALL